ncbi:hypothetical protein WJX74_004146 [Apatococcus lobatus]|uniref:U-box domain-containing protein n=1 Tax=Apatococcus lobatus TaxID=904363 RepID=A0AAW1RSJ9_9CHLO
MPSVRQQHPQEWLCPISWELMLFPCTLVQTNQTFERTNIERWLANGGCICPLTGTILENQELQDNQGLADQIHAWLSDQGYTPDQWAEQTKLLRQSVAPGSFSVSASSFSAAARPHMELHNRPVAPIRRHRRPNIFRKLLALMCCFGSWEEFQKAEEMRRAWVYTLDRPPAGLPAGTVAAQRNPNEVPCYPAGWPSLRLFSGSI